MINILNYVYWSEKDILRISKGFPTIDHFIGKNNK